MKTNKMIVAAITLTLALLFAGCVPQGFNINFSSNNVKQENETSQSTDLNDAKSLYVENQTGNIIVKKTDDSKVTIDTRIKIEGQVSDEVEKVKSELQTKAEVDNGTLEIKAVCKDGSDFWRWKQNNYRMLNVSVTFEVSLPRDLENYKLKLVTGNITIEGLNGSVDTENVTGNIDLNDMKLTGANRVQLITGNVGVDSDIADAENLSIANITGNITVKLPSDSSMTLDASVVTGNVNGSLIGNAAVKALAGASINKTFGDGKTDVAVKLVTGNITISKQ